MKKLIASDGRSWKKVVKLNYFSTNFVVKLLVKLFKKNISTKLN